MTDAGLNAPMRLLSRRQQAAELWAGEQLQEALKLASMGDVQPGKSASIKSISDSIQSSMACCLSSRASSLSVSGWHRKLSNCFAEAFGYDKNERKRVSDEPDAPLPQEGEDLAGEVYAAIGGDQGHQADHDAGDGLDGTEIPDGVVGYSGTILLGLERPYGTRKKALYWQTNQLQLTSKDQPCQWPIRNLCFIPRGK